MEPTQEDEDKVLSAEKGLCYLQDTLHKIHNNHKTQIQDRDMKHKEKTEEDIVENHEAKWQTETHRKASTGEREQPESKR